MKKKKKKDKLVSNFDEKYKLTDSRNSMSFNQVKHKENHTKIHCNQTAKTDLKAKIPLNAAREKS